jgi:hypothetical protein
MHLSTKTHLKYFEKTFNIHEKRKLSPLNIITLTQPANNPKRQIMTLPHGTSSIGSDMHAIFCSMIHIRFTNYIHKLNNNSYDLTHVSLLYRQQHTDTAASNQDT